MTEDLKQAHAYHDNNNSVSKYTSRETFLLLVLLTERAGILLVYENIVFVPTCNFKFKCGSNLQLQLHHTSYHRWYIYFTSSILEIKKLQLLYDLVLVLYTHVCVWTMFAPVHVCYLIHQTAFLRRWWWTCSSPPPHHYTTLAQYIHRRIHRRSHR